MAYKTYKTKTKSSFDKLRKVQEVKSPAPAYDPAKQTQGYKKRLEGSGIDVEKATDKRNFIEKGLNLKQDQNLLFDIFEVLERPQQAIFGGVKALQEGGSFGEGMKEGITGNDVTRFKEILHNAGMENSEGFGIDDVLGFAGDVLLDPADLAIWAGATAAAPITGGGSLVGAGALTTALNTAMDAGKLAKTGKTLLKGAQVTDKTIDALKNTMKIMGKGKVGRKARKSSSELFMRGAAGTVKGGFGIGNKGAKKVLGFLDARNIDRGIEGAGNLVTNYEDFIKSGQKMFTNLASIPAHTYDKVLKAMGKGGRSKHEMKILWEGAQKKIDEIAASSGKTRDEIFEELTEFKELNYEAKTDVRNVLENKDRWDVPIDEAVAENVRNVLNNPIFSDLKVLNESTSAASKTRKAVHVEEMHKAKETLVGEVDDQIKVLEEAIAKEATLVPRKAPDNLDLNKINDNLGVIERNEIPKVKAEGLPDNLDLNKINDNLGVIERNEIPKSTSAVKSKAAIKQERQLKTLRQLKEGILKVEDVQDVRKMIDTLEKSGNFSKKAIREMKKDLMKYADNLKGEGLNVFDDLYEAVTLPNSQKAFRLREGNDVREVLSKISGRMDDLGKRFDEKELLAIEAGRLGAKASETTKLKKLFKDDIFTKLPSTHALSGKKFDDIFTLKNGVYEVTDRKAYDELIDFINPQNRAAQEIGGSRFLTDERRGKLAEKYGDNFKFKNEYDEIANTYDDLAKLNDKIHETNIYSKVDGYLHHTVDADTAATPGKLKTKLDEAATKGEYEPITFTGNTKAFKGRKYNMSVEEANMIAKDNAARTLEKMKADPKFTPKEYKFMEERATQDLFSKSINDSVSDMIDASSKYSTDINKVHKALIGGTLADPDIFRPAVEDAAGKVSKRRGYVVVNGSDVKSKLNKMTESLDGKGEMSKDFKKFLKNIVGDGKFELDENVWNMIGVLDTSSNKKLMEDFVSMIDSTNNLFKQTKLMSPGFQMRNLVGNASNLYLAGVSPAKIPGLLIKGNGVLKRGKGYIEALQKANIMGADIADPKVLDEILQVFKKTPGIKNADKALEEYKYYIRFLEGNFDDAGSAVHDIDEILKKTRNKSKVKNPDLFDKTTGAIKTNTWDRIVDLNATSNEAIDKRYRLGFLMEADKNPDMLRRMNVDNAEAAVRRVLFDPRDLTRTEKDVFKKLIPFYTFAKKNLAYQMQNLPQNAVRYKRLKKTIGATWDFAGGDIDDIESYKKENFWMPVPFTKVKDGKYTAAKLNLPLGDLADFFESPSRKIVSSMSPLLRAPLESVVNKQTFTQRPIEDFEGQRGYILPEISRKQEYLLGQTGLDVPVAAGMDILRTLRNPQETVGGNIQSAIGRTLVSEGDTARAQRSKDYQELQEVKDLMKYYKQEGVPILQLAEIENQKPQQSNLMARLQALSKVR